MHNQKYPNTNNISNTPNSQTNFLSEKQMRSSVIDPYSKNQILVSPTNSGGFMKASMLNNYQNKKPEKIMPPINGFESPRASYSSQQQSLQQYSQPAINSTGNINQQQTKDLNGMGKSCIRKESNTEFDVVSYLKEIDKKILKISQTLYNHEQLLNDKSQLSGASTSITNLSDINYEGLQHDIGIIVQQEVEKQLKRIQNILFKDIERFRIELKDQQQRQLVHRQQFDFFIKKLQQETYAIKKEINKDFSQIRQTNIVELRNLYDIINKQFQAKLNRIHQANKEAFHQIQTNFMDIKHILEDLKGQNVNLKLSLEQLAHQNIDGTTKIFITNKKFNDPLFLRYKQTIQILNYDPSNSGNNGSNAFKNNSGRQRQQIQGRQRLLNEVNYYVDKQGFLLDREYRYLVDKNNKQIQFREKHLNMLKVLNILK